MKQRILQLKSTVASEIISIFFILVISSTTTQKLQPGRIQEFVINKLVNLFLLQQLPRQAKKLQDMEEQPMNNPRSQKELRHRYGANLIYKIVFPIKRNYCHDKMINSTIIMKYLDSFQNEFNVEWIKNYFAFLNKHFFSLSSFRSYFHFRDLFSFQIIL